MATITRRSLVMSILGCEDKLFTISVKKDDHSWTVQKCYSEFVFFRATIFETAQKFTNHFPEWSDDLKEVITEMNDWIKECGEVLGMSATLNALYYGFVKVHEKTAR